jgi:adenylylsulfate kinase
MNFCLWLTGLPGSGKSTILKELEHMLSESGTEFVVLHLDLIRKVLTPDPKYTEDERALVYRSLALMAQLLVKHGDKGVVIDATGNRSEYRNLARRLIPEFAEIYIRCPLKTCQVREVSRRNQTVQKNLYHNAIKGRLKGQLPGISVPYEAPKNPELLIDSDILSPRESAEKIRAYIKSRWAL